MLRALAFASLVLACATARALEPERPVFVATSACAPEVQAEVLRLLRVELGSRLHDRASEGALEVLLACSGDRAELTAQAPGHFASTRALDLAAAPLELRPRIMALQIAELVRAPAEPIAAPPPPAPVAKPAVPAPPRRERERERSDYEVQLLAIGSAFAPDGRALFGAALAVDGRVAWLRLGVDGALATRSDRSALGEDSVWLGYLAPRATAELALRPLRLQLGAGHAFGLARIDATSASASGMSGAVSGAWLAPHGLLDLGCSITPGLALHARGRLGWVIVPVVGRVARGADVEVRGLWLHAELGIGLSL